MSLDTGSRFDRYAIAGRIGQGGMGEVYRAYDTKLQRSIALKVLRAAPTGASAGGLVSPGGALSTDGVAQMMREARAAAALDHPNAVAIFDVGMVDGASFIAMEFIEGKTLRAFVGDETVPLKQRVRWLVDAARALAAAHERGLVHRDIKPENIMVRDDGVVKVLDFGIARRTRGPVDALASTAGFSLETLSGKGMLIGTPHYMSPEQMRGESVTASADVFSWGIVAYELLSGALPWSASANAIELVSQILSSTAEPLGARAPNVPAPVAALVMSALGKTPAERPASMDAVIAALEPHGDVSTLKRAPAALSLAPSPAAPSTKTQLASPTQPSPVVPAASKRGRWLAAGGLLAVLVAASALFLARAPPAASPPSAPGASSASGPAVVVTDVASKSPEAASSFRIGEQAWRDATDDVAMAEFQKASELDPSFAAAHLRRAVVASWPDDGARQAYQRAVQLRASLSAHDRVMLEAFEPWADLVPDLGALEQRLTAGLVRYPADPELALLLCRTRVALGNDEGAAAACSGALHADGGLALAWYLEALAAGVKGDVETAKRDYAECLTRAPNASACLRDVILLRASEGSCDAALQSARSLVAAYPRDAGHYVLLAQMLYGAGQPIESVGLALSQASRQAAAGTDGARRSLRAQATLDIASGSFDAAGEKLVALEREIDASPAELDHFDVAYLRMQLAFESGKPAEDARLAADYLKRRAAWTPAPHVDPGIYAEREEYLAGALPKSGFEGVRARWLARENERRFPSALFGDSPADRWAIAFAGAASSADDAKAALAALPAAPAGGEEPGLLRRSIAWRAEVGRAHLLAGDVTGATPLLQSAAQSCGSLLEPIAAAHALVDLGAAREASRDVPAACAAYAKVTALWGGAKPRSVTAERAKQRAAALKCGP